MDSSEASWFETSEMSGSFLLSTPQVKNSWSLCGQANGTSPAGFITEMSGEGGGVGYVAFSGIQGTGSPSQEEAAGFDQSLVRLNDETMSSVWGMFAPLMKGDGHGEEPVMVHPEMVRLFTTVYGRSEFQAQVTALLDKCRSIVFTGHSIGGTIASLAALWLLSYAQSILRSNPSVELTKKFSALSVLCVTFGSPLLGNKSLSQAILRERWGGSFCHVILQKDPVPRLLMTSPSANLIPQLCQLLVCSLSPNVSSAQIPDQRACAEGKAAFFAALTSSYVEKVALVEYSSGGRSFWPFGSYLFCSEDGAVCVDNDAMVMNQMIRSPLQTISSSSKLDEHFRYGEYIEKLSAQLLMSTRSFKGRLPELSYEASIAFSLQSLGIHVQDPDASSVKDCLKLARRMGQAPNINSAHLAIRLSRFAPYRAEIEWYKSCCDNSAEQMGYYDSFKGGRLARREARVNMNRYKLAAFWNDVIRMWENNELPYDFHRRAKWVHASLSYKLLVEPLDIADYYRSGMHLKKGHYVENGRERRYEIFDRWWNEKCATEAENKASIASRTRYASVTQDSLFWARVEEARDWLDQLKVEAGNPKKQRSLWERLNEFECYSSKMVREKEVSEDVLVKNSSFMAWTNEWTSLKLQWKQQQNVLPAASMAGNPLA
ncbi:hypothetical protein MLD38_031493 [Melastoma candidum]|uniref:Uncharacterized protein n=1 Tax=Melastoma candidum TaxID=119954 RepID=A0ACB9MPU9_9MYRT|nr:hypothetical protein MLD38_031493 [Melastoma candidum]